MIQISEKTAKALLEAAQTATKKNKTLGEAVSLVCQKLNEPQVKSHAQIENLRRIQTTALRALTERTNEVFTHMKEILRVANCAIAGKPYCSSPTSTAQPVKKKAAQAGKTAAKP